MQGRTLVKLAGLGLAGCAALTACGPVSYFQGSYYHHGVGMTVDAAGKGTVSYRIYSWCGPGVPQPCDRIVGNTILDGGHATFTLTSPLGSHTASGIITSGNQVRVGQRVTLVPLRTKNGKPSVVNAAGVGPWSGWLTFCGSEYVANCGA